VNQEIVITPRVRSAISENRYDIITHFKTFSEHLETPIEKLIDTAVFKNAWLLYGSKKSETQEPYLISKIFNDQLETVELWTAFEHYPVFDEQEEQIHLTPDNIEYYLPRILSIVPYGRKVQEIRLDITTSHALMKYIHKPVYKNEVEDDREDEQVEEDIETAKKLLSMMNVSRADDYHNWMTLGWALFNISRGSEEGLDAWLEFSRQSSKYNQAKCIYEWSHMEDRKKITIGTLKYFAKQDNPEMYQQFLNKRGQALMNMEFRTSHYDLALLLYEQFGNEYVYTDAGWYQYSSHHWEFINNGYELRSKISKELVEFFKRVREEVDSDKVGSEGNDRKRCEDREKLVNKIIESLKSTPFKTNIMRECQEVFHIRDFERKLNTNRYLIGFTNGVYDLELNIFRDGLPSDFISTQMSIPYREFTMADSRVQDVYNFFEKVFPDSSLRRYFMDVMSETFVGYNHRKQVYFWTGEGDNGKSITQMFFEKMFGRLSIKAPTTLITSKRPNAGSANAELARAGNGVRTIFLEEPDPDEEIFTGVFKHLSGNDSIYTRDLYQSGKSVSEIIPMFRLFVICNKLPKIRKGGDKATWNRIRVIPFESTFSKTAPVSPEQQLKDKIFPVDTSLAQKIPNLVEAFAWLLLQHRLKSKIADPEKVMAATDRYRMNNDYIHQFTVQMITEDEKGGVTPNDLYAKYKEWLDEGVPGVKPPPLLEFTEYYQKKWGDMNEDGLWLGKRFRFERASGNATGNDVNLNALL
jgi:P4 family phage/plasmid primase-like protien